VKDVFEDLTGKAENVTLTDPRTGKIVLPD
jgi:hypothetical protein